MGEPQTYEWCALTRVRSWDGSLILTHRGQTVRLSESAEVIWRSIAGAPTVEVIAAALAAEFGVSTAEASTDVRAWLRDMVEAGFVVMRDPTPASFVPVCG